MAANNTLIGALRVEATLDSGKFIDGARKIQATSKQTEDTVKKSFSGLGASVKAGIAGFVGALSIGAITQVIGKALDYAASLGEVSQQLGVTTKDLQAFRYAAGQLGVDQKTLETGLQHLTETLGKIAAGAEKPTKALEAIGLSARDLAGLDTGDAFRKIADALEPIGDRAQRAAIELALFGESGSKLDTMLSGGSSALNELSDAAERLGIVLSDEQIRKADETADKLDALKTVLSAKIAGVVADNADSILQLADALAQVVVAAGDAVRAMQNFYRNALNAAAKFSSDHPTIARVVFGDQFGPNVRAANLRSRLAAAGPTGAQRFDNLFNKSPKASTASVSQFLAPRSRSGGGGSRRHSGGGRSRQAPRDRSDDVTFQFEQEQRRAEMDILRAKQQLAGSSEQRAQLSLQIIALEKETADAEVQDKVRRAEREFAEGKITQAALDQVKVQADILLAKNEEEARLKQQAFVEEQLARNEQATFEASQQRRQFEIDALQFADEQATTQADHRRIQLQILDAQIEQRRLELEHEKQLAIRNGATAEEIRIIQDKIDHLGVEQGVGAARIEANTRNPLEEWAATVPQTAQEITEAFQKIQADGLDRLSDSLADVILGTKSLKEAAHEMAASFIADSIRMITRMLLMKALTAAIGGMSGGGSVGGDVTSSGIYPDLGFASGGFVSGAGGPTSDAIPAMLSNGEFVVNAKAVKAFLPLLKMLNSGRIKHARDGLHLAPGGLVTGLPLPRMPSGPPVSVSNDNSGNMGGPVSLTFHNDFRGADQSAVAAIQARLDRMQAELPSTIVGTVQDAKQRFIIR